MFIKEDRINDFYIQVPADLIFLKKDAIEPNPLHHNNLYATTKAERSNLQERSNNQENDLMRPHKNKRRGNEPLITLTRDL